MNDCLTTLYPERKRLIGQFHPFIKSASAVFAYQAGMGIEVAEDASVTIRQLIDSRNIIRFVMKHKTPCVLRYF